MSPPEPLTLRANELDHALLVWHPAADAPSRPPVFLVHGFMDAAGTWDAVAPRLAALGHTVYAPHMRGFGAAPRVPAGAYYHFTDYVFDLADMVDAVSPDAPVVVVGHSMGGTVVTLYAGAMPERVLGLASLEGVGPPDNPMEIAPVRMRAWIDGVRKVRTQGHGAGTLTREEALRRLSVHHASIDRGVLEGRLEHLVEPAGDAGEVRWRYDPLHRTTAPFPFFADVFAAYARRVTCPVLFVGGGPLGFHPPDEEARVACFAQVERVELPDAGHMMHWTRPAELADRLVAFLSRVSG
ncbi:MAG: alpha/beta hydrolase [Myxococcales bacterium]|nr:alpha/beta hydrolase [Myxococcales bacterium]